MGAPRYRRRVLEVELNRHDSIVRGPGASELLMQVSGRRQVWSNQRRGFSCQERTARDTIAAAERLNYDIVITGPRAAVEPARPPTPPSVLPFAEPEPVDVNLW